MALHSEWNSKKAIRLYVMFFLCTCEDNAGSTLGLLQTMDSQTSTKFWSKQCVQNNEIWSVNEEVRPIFGTGIRK